MRVVINALPAGMPGATGIGQFTRGLIRALIGHPDCDPVLLRGEAPLPYAAEQVAVSPWSERWEQFELPGLLEELRAVAYLTPLFSAPIACAVPRLVTVHDTIPLDHPELTTPAFAHFWQRWIGPGTRAAARVLTVSQSARDRLIDGLELAADHVSVVPQAVSPGFVREAQRLAVGQPLRANQLPGFLAPSRYWLATGGFDPRKNLERAVEAFLSADRGGRVLAIAGGSLREQPPAWADDPRIVRLGYVPESQMPALVRGAHAALFPSLAEGFGRPALEAMTLGTPLLISSIDALEELAGDAAVRVEASSVAAIARGMAALDADPAAREARVLAGRRRAAEFSDRAMGEALVDALQEVA